MLCEQEENMKISRIFIGAAAALALGACGAGGGTAAGRSGEPVTLKVTAQKGAKYDSALSMEMKFDLPAGTTKGADGKPSTSPSQDTLTMEATMSSELTEVADGKYTWVDTVTDVSANGTGQMSMLAQLMKAIKGVKTTIVMDEHGKILSQKTEGGTSGASGQIEGFGFPDKAVKVGDSWESKVNNNGQEVTMKSTVTEITNDVVKIDATMSGVEGLKLSSPLKVELDRTTGRPIKTDGTMEVTQGGAHILMKISMHKK